MTGAAMRSGDVPDADLAGLDQGGIWLLLWRMRDSGSAMRSVRAVFRRWERITGRRYYG